MVGQSIFVRRPTTSAPITAHSAAFSIATIEYIVKPPHPVTSQSIQKAKRSCGGHEITETAS
jgi:hypothetical protein